MGIVLAALPSRLTGTPSYAGWSSRSVGAKLTIITTLTYFNTIPQYKHGPRLKIYRIYSNKCRGAYLIFRVSGAEVYQGQRLFEGGVYLRPQPH